MTCSRLVLQWTAVKTAGQYTYRRVCALADLRACAYARNRAQANARKRVQPQGRNRAGAQTGNARNDGDTYIDRRF